MKEPGLCSQNQCRNRALAKCKYCHSAYCKQHAHPFTPATPFRDSKEHNDWARNFENGGHPCPQYYDELERQRKEKKARDYANLDGHLRTPRTAYAGTTIPALARSATPRITNSQNTKNEHVHREGINTEHHKPAALKKCEHSGPADIYDCENSATEVCEYCGRTYCRAHSRPVAPEKEHKTYAHGCPAYINSVAKQIEGNDKNVIGKIFNLALTLLFIPIVLVQGFVEWIFRSPWRILAISIVILYLVVAVPVADNRPLVPINLTLPTLNFSVSFPIQNDTQFTFDTERVILEKTNKQRIQNGLRPLILDTSLSTIAREHSIDMAANNFFSHDNLQGEDPTQRAMRRGYPTTNQVGDITWTGIAENIGKMPTGNVEGVGYVSNTPEDVGRHQVESWMESPGHRSNILNPNYEVIGIGVAKEGIYYISTQDFR